MYTFLDTAANKRLFANVDMRQNVLTVAAQTTTAGDKNKSVDVLRASVNLTKPRYLQPAGCGDSCNPVLVTNKAEIILSGAFVDQAELKAHLDEAVRCTMHAWTTYKLKDGFLPPLDATFASE